MLYTFAFSILLVGNDQAVELLCSLALGSLSSHVIIKRKIVRKYVENLVRFQMYAVPGLQTRQQPITYKKSSEVLLFIQMYLFFICRTSITHLVGQRELHSKEINARRYTTRRSNQILSQNYTVNPVVICRVANRVGGVGNFLPYPYLWMFNL